MNGLQVKTLQERLSDSNSLTARLKRELLLVKAKAEALEFAVAAKDAEIELLHTRQENQDSQVCPNPRQAASTDGPLPSDPQAPQQSSGPTYAAFAADKKAPVCMCNPGANVGVNWLWYEALTSFQVAQS